MKTSAKGGVAQMINIVERTDEMVHFVDARVDIFKMTRLHAAAALGEGGCPCWRSTGLPGRPSSTTWHVARRLSSYTRRALALRLAQRSQWPGRGVAGFARRAQQHWLEQNSGCHGADQGERHQLTHAQHLARPRAGPPVRLRIGESRRRWSASAVANVTKVLPKHNESPTDMRCDAIGVAHDSPVDPLRLLRRSDARAR
jgi:hypothetical protein